MKGCKTNSSYWVHQYTFLTSWPLPSSSFHIHRCLTCEPGNQGFIYLGQLEVQQSWRCKFSKQLHVEGNYIATEWYGFRSTINGCGEFWRLKPLFQERTIRFFESKKGAFTRMRVDKFSWEAEPHPYARTVEAETLKNLVSFLPDSWERADTLTWIDSAGS